jgi:hypothetical protein
MHFIGGGIMRKFLATVAVLAMSATALAGGSLDLRGSFIGTSKMKNAANADVDGAGAFVSERAWIGFSGKLSDSISGKVTWDALANAAVFGEVSHKWSDSTVLSMGKLADGETGGFEARRSSAEYHFRSAAYEKRYPQGMKVDYMMGSDNNLSLVFTNQNYGTGTNPPTGATSATGYGLAWEGGFGSSDVILSYHNVPSATAANANTFMGLGWKYKTDGWWLALDYLMNTYAKQGSTANSDFTKSSIVADFVYNMGAWSPNFKLEMSTLTNAVCTNGVGCALSGPNSGTLNVAGIATNAASSNTIGITQFSLGADYATGTDGFNYHLAYASNAINLTSGFADANKTVTDTKVFAGFHFKGDFLK